MLIGQQNNHQNESGIANKVNYVLDASWHLESLQKIIQFPQLQMDRKTNIYFEIKSCFVTTKRVLKIGE